MGTGECICNTCKNLKSVFSDEGEPVESTCQFGFPSKSCEENCLDKDCELTCRYFISDDVEDEPTAVFCSKCGKTLRQACNDNEAGNTYCVECFLSMD